MLRHGDEDLTLLFKYTAQGLSHGHYDKLSFSLYERGDEVLQDYGMARFVNIEQKGGGNYLKENTSWAKQTIAHNTITRDETSHFRGKYEIGSRHYSELRFFDASDEDTQVVSASEINAYPGTEMMRTMALIDNGKFEKPFLLDILRIVSDEKHQYDLPFYFMGQVLKSNFVYESPASLSALGEKNGYQHLYLEGVGYPSSKNTRLSWIGNDKFYTLTSVTDDADELLFTRVGANDPDFNLRRDAAFMIRRRNAKDTVFATVVEAHGSYSPVSELAVNSNSNIAKLEVVYDDANYTAVLIQNREGDTSAFMLSNTDASADTEHELVIGEKTYRWMGPYHYLGP